MINREQERRRLLVTCSATSPVTLETKYRGLAFRQIIQDNAELRRLLFFVLPIIDWVTF